MPACVTLRAVPMSSRSSLRKTCSTRSSISRARRARGVAGPSAGSGVTRGRLPTSASGASTSSSIDGNGTTDGSANTASDSSRTRNVASGSRAATAACHAACTGAGSTGDVRRRRASRATSSATPSPACGGSTTPVMSSYGPKASSAPRTPGRDVASSGAGCGGESGVGASFKCGGRARCRGGAGFQSTST